MVRNVNNLIILLGAGILLSPYVTASTASAQDLPLIGAQIRDARTTWEIYNRLQECGQIRANRLEDDPTLNCPTPPAAVSVPPSRASYGFLDVGDNGVIRTNGISASSRFQAAVSADPESGIQVGAQVSPGRFFGGTHGILDDIAFNIAQISSSSLPGQPATFYLGRTRLGVGIAFGHTSGYLPDTSALIPYLGSPTPIPPSQRDTQRNNLINTTTAIVEACTFFISDSRNYDFSSAWKDRFLVARAVCGYEKENGNHGGAGASPRSLTNAAVVLASFMRDLVDTGYSFLWYHASFRGIYSILDNFQSNPNQIVPTYTGDQINSAVTRYYQHQFSWQVGFQFDGDFFLNLPGSLPPSQPTCTTNRSAPYDSSTLPWDSSLGQERLRGELALHFPAGHTVSLTVGAGRFRDLYCWNKAPTERETRTAAFNPFLNAIVSYSYTWRSSASSTSTSVTPVAGVELAAQMSNPAVGFSNGGFQVSQFSLTPYVGIRLSQTVAFRLGFPIASQTFVQEPLPAMPGMNGQVGVPPVGSSQAWRWTFPVSLSTTLVTN